MTADRQVGGALDAHLAAVATGLRGPTLPSAPAPSLPIRSGAAEPRPPAGDGDRPLRIALLAYRGNPHCGGQGVYVRNLSRALVALGHQVEVIAGQPYPEVSEGVRLTRLPSLDLYRPDDPFRIPWPREFRDPVDVLEFAVMCTAGFPEPLTFSLRASRLLRRRRGEFDVIHDNQCLGYGILRVARDCAPVVATVHHPITVDRRLELAHAPTLRRRLTLWRWYGFTRMQVRVARRLPRLITVSANSQRDISRDFDIPADRLRVIDLGVDPTVFRPLDEVSRVPGRIITTASADVPMKGLVTLVTALAAVRDRYPGAELMVVGRPRPEGAAARAIDALGLRGAVHFRGGVTQEDIVRLYAESQVAVVPSLYEGFSLPAIEAMAAAVPLVASRAGALPEVVGADGDTALLVEPGDATRLAQSVVRLLDDAALRRRVGRAGRERVLRRFTWEATARATADEYRQVLAAC